MSRSAVSCWAFLLLLRGVKSVTAKFIETICIADFPIFHVYLTKFISNLNNWKNSDFLIRLLKDLNPQDSIFHYMRQPKKETLMRYTF